MIRRHAFTLIELLVVISIIALLASMLMVAIRMVRESARTTVCVNNIRQLGLAFGAYQNDWDGVIPMQTNTYGAETAADYYAPDFTYCQWYAPLRQYVENVENSTAGRGWICPKSNWTRVNKGYGLSYAMNDATIGVNLVLPTGWGGLSLARFSAPGSLMILGERWAMQAGGAVDWNGNVEPPYHPPSPPCLLETATPGAKQTSLRVRHRGKSTYLLADWHVEVLSPWERCNPANTDASPQLSPNIWTGVP